MSVPNSEDRPTLLIVDDDPDVLRALAFVTDARGFQAECCRSAREAIAIAGPGRPLACLVIDQKLPDMPGIELLAALRGQGVEAPAILITTAPSAALRREAAAASAPIVEKPLLDEALFTEIGRLAMAD
ncbi:MAG: response regulator [Brevundimonas sp.]